LLYISIGVLYNYNMGREPKHVQPPIHNRLQVLRAERGLSRQQLSDAVGVNYQTIGYLERGDYSPSLDLAFRLAEFFDLPIEAIFARTPFAGAPALPVGRVNAGYSPDRPPVMGSRH
jgi:DNA-binding XRE family transcriptional regulator